MLSQLFLVFCVISSLLLKEVLVSAEIQDPNVHSNCLESPASEKRTATLHMLSGLIASGKSTFAKKLQEEHKAVIFSPDEWILRLYGEDFPVERFQEVGDRVKDVIWSVASALLRDHNIDVVLDFSFWHRSERDTYKDKAREVGANVQLYRVFCPNEIIEQRLTERNANLPPGTFRVSIETFRSWRDSYEVPHVDEQAITISTHEDLGSDSCASVKDEL